MTVIERRVDEDGTAWAVVLGGDCPWCSRSEPHKHQFDVESGDITRVVEPYWVPR